MATPTPAIPFARPVPRPANTVAARQAAPASSEPPVQRLTFGSGAGRQEGVVLVRFRVDENGSVSSAHVVERCPFSLLNQSAARTIRDEWRFPPGPVRVYEVSITFQLR
jgi:TonB family protein